MQCVHPSAFLLLYVAVRGGGEPEKEKEEGKGEAALVLPFYTIFSSLSASIPAGKRKKGEACVRGGKKEEGRRSRLPSTSSTTPPLFPSRPQEI